MKEYLLKDLPKGTKFHFRGTEKHRFGPNTDCTFVVMGFDGASRKFAVALVSGGETAIANAVIREAYENTVVYPVDLLNTSVPDKDRVLLSTLKPGDRFRVKDIPFVYVLDDQKDDEGRWGAHVEGNPRGCSYAFMDPKLTEVTVETSEPVFPYLTALNNLKPGEKFKAVNTDSSYEVLEFDPDGRVWVVLDPKPSQVSGKLWFPGQLKVEVSEAVKNRMQGDLKPISAAIKKIQETSEEQRKKDEVRCKIRLQNLEEGDCYRVQTRLDGVNWKTIFESSDRKVAEEVYDWTRGELMYTEDLWKTEWEE